MDQINTYRAEIDSIDTDIITLLSRRFEVVRMVGKWKKIHHIQPLQSERWQEVLISRMNLAQKNGISPEWIKGVWEKIHDYALQLERDI